MLSDYIINLIVSHTALFGKETTAYVINILITVFCIDEPHHRFYTVLEPVFSLLTLRHIVSKHMQSLRSTTVLGVLLPFLVGTHK